MSVPNSIPCPDWLTPDELINLRRLIGLKSKLQAVKDLKAISKDRIPVWSTDEWSGKSINVGGWGLKESKDFIDQLVPLGPDPLAELKVHVSNMKLAKETLRIILKDSMPWLSSENYERAVEDPSYLDSLIQTLSTGNNFGI